MRTVEGKKCSVVPLVFDKRPTETYDAAGAEKLRGIGYDLGEVYTQTRFSPADGGLQCVELRAPELFRGTEY